MNGHFDWAAKWAMYLPNKIALKEIGSGRSLTYRQINNLGNSYANYFTNRWHVKKGDRIAIIAETCLEYMMLLSAAQKTGAILVPLNYRLSPREIDFLLGDAAPKVVLYQEKYLESIMDCPNFRKIPVHVPLESSGALSYEMRDSIDETPQPVEITEDDPVLILYTSGTTGFPKGAIYTHKMMFWNSENTALRLGLTDGDRTINVMPFFHTGGWNVLQTPFFHRGATVAMLPKFDAELVLDLLESEKITIFMGVPTMLKMMADTAQFDSANLSALRYFIVGGEAMPLPLIEKWHHKGVPIRQGYGLTEFGPNVTSLHQDDAVRKMGSIGKPNFYIDIKIVDDNENPVAPNEIGEFCLKGPTCTPGYWNNPEATAAAIKDGWFFTGDYVRQDSDGYIYVVDRKKNMYISGGENVYPTEVEKFLRTHPEIADVAIIGVPDEKWGESGKAFVVRAAGSQLSAADILAFCKGNLAKFKIPKHICFLPELPKGDTGKIDRKQLKNND